MKKKVLIPVLVLLLPLALAAMDFGLLTNHNMGAGNSGGDGKFDYQADILPRLSFLVGDSGDFIISGGITLGYDDAFHMVPELLHTELSLNLGNAVFKAGRMHYTAPLAFIAEGLFDGAHFSYASAAGIFSIGAWYTGLLYKKTANITMTAADQLSFGGPVDYGDFFNTYFAPRRLFFSLDYEHSSVAELLQLKAAVSGQADFSDGDEKYNSQYLTLKAAVPVKDFLFEFGGCFETAQIEPAMDVDEDKTFNIAFAWDLGIHWTLPVSFNSRLSLTGHFAGGKTDDLVGAFVPITTKFYGDIFKPRLSGLTIFGLGYTARLAQTLGISLNVTHFVRNDLGTFKDYPVTGTDNDGYFLGSEFFGRFIWSPFSDLQLNFGGGVFLPSLGNTGPDEKSQWRVELAAILALY